MLQDALAIIALGSHRGGTYLAHAHSVAPAVPMKDDALGDTIGHIKQFDREGTALQVRMAQHATDFQFATC